MVSWSCWLLKSKLLIACPTSTAAVTSALSLCRDYAVTHFSTLGSCHTSTNADSLHHNLCKLLTSSSQNLKFKKKKQTPDSLSRAGSANTQIACGEAIASRRRRYEPASDFCSWQAAMASGHEEGKLISIPSNESARSYCNDQLLCSRQGSLNTLQNG